MLRRLTLAHPGTLQIRLFRQPGCILSGLGAGGEACDPQTIARLALHLGALQLGMNILLLEPVLQGLDT